MCQPVKCCELVLLFFADIWVFASYFMHIVVKVIDIEVLTEFHCKNAETEVKISKRSGLSSLVLLPEVNIFSHDGVSSLSFSFSFEFLFHQ